MKKIAIVGLPNTGKSHLYHMLTGDYSIVANYPLTTVEPKKKKIDLGGKEYLFFDTPGLHSFFIHSEEELVVRNLIFDEKPEVLIQCIDANQLKQSLDLTADLLELKIPMIIVLSAVSETYQKGIRVNSLRLSKILKIPVVEILDIGESKRAKVFKAIENATIIDDKIIYPDRIEEYIKTLEEKLPEDISFKRKLAILTLENDKTIYGVFEKDLSNEEVLIFYEQENIIRNLFIGSLGRAIRRVQTMWSSEIYEKVSNKNKRKNFIYLEAFARACRHPVLGIPILLAFIFLSYFLVVNVAGFIEGSLSGFIVDPMLSYISTITGSAFVNDFLLGDYGILTLGLFNAVVTVLPILSVFFLMFGALEDIGYLPNLTVLTSRLFKYIGISGKSIMPLVLGFGCKTMATLTTRGLTSKKEKYIAIYLIAFAIPCSAQFGLNMAILGKVGVLAFLIAFGALLFLEVMAGFVLNKIIKDDAPSNYIQELPPIRVPNLKAIFIKTYYRLLWFLKEAVPIFIIAALVLFTLDKSGLLDLLKRALDPIITNWLGLPIDMVDALILTMARHEAAAGLIFKMVNSGSIDFIQSIVAVVITTMFVPCFANIVAMCKELGVKRGLVMVFIINTSAFIFAGILNKLLHIFF
ncbi:MAG: ferrous iron transporter B [Pseudomonadota bacterium]